MIPVVGIPGKLPIYFETRNWRDFDRTCQPVDAWHGGHHAAMKRLHHFTTRLLPTYEKDRNKPELDGTSALSPYQHFGHIGSLTIACAPTYAQVGAWAPVLRHHGIPATMFVVSGWADGKHPDQYQHVLDWKGVSALQEYGISLASHSATHPDFGRLGAAEAREELEVSRQRMEQMLGLTVEEFAIPFGQSRNWTDAARIAAEGAGYKVVYAQAVETRPAGTVPRTFITRIDIPRLFRAALAGSYDRWEEWY